MKIGNGCKYNNLYPLMVINPKGAVNIIESQDSNLWHGRLNHMSQAELDQLMTINYIPKVLTKTNFSEHCSYGKQTRSSHSFHYETIRQLLQRLHTDICGPMPERRLGGSRYFITFIDDCTWKVWAYSLRSKDEVLTVFSRWLAKVENQSEHRVKTLRFDNGGE